MYVIAVFLCRIDDGGGHDLASGDEHLSFINSPSSFQCLFGRSCPSSLTLASLSSNAGQERRL